MKKISKLTAADVKWRNQVLVPFDNSDPKTLHDKLPWGLCRRTVVFPIQLNESGLENNVIYASILVVPDDFLTHKHKDLISALLVEGLIAKVTGLIIKGLPRPGVNSPNMIFMDDAYFDNYSEEIYLALGDHRTDYYYTVDGNPERFNGKIFTNKVDLNHISGFNTGLRSLRPFYTGNPTQGVSTFRGANIEGMYFFWENEFTPEELDYIKDRIRKHPLFDNAFNTLHIKINDAKLVLTNNYKWEDDTLFPVANWISVSIIADTQHSLYRLLETNPSVITQTHTKFNTNIKFGTSSPGRYDLVIRSAYWNKVRLVTYYSNGSIMSSYPLSPLPWVLQMPSMMYNDVNPGGGGYTFAVGDFNSGVSESIEPHMTNVYGQTPTLIGHNASVFNAKNTEIDPVVKVYDNNGVELRRGLLDINFSSSDNNVLIKFNQDSFTTNDEIMIVGQSIKM